MLEQMNKNIKVFACCGWYLLSLSNKPIICPHCGKAQTKPLNAPHVIVFN